jgi:hypothetical protein
MEGVIYRIGKVFNVNTKEGLVKIFQEILRFTSISDITSIFISKHWKDIKEMYNVIIDLSIDNKDMKIDLPIKETIDRYKWKQLQTIGLE